ncbi:MAG: alpha/beta hydrolase [Anaerolineae bacterium]|nr:alpha/beta hydrolase [Anaerolineae bacterium]
MSSIATDQGIVHYEVYGRGLPIILLHGWLGSWALWQQTMTHLGQSYRTYALDFWGFGESGKKRSTYAVQDFTSLVDQFMDRLGIAEAPLVGHSMGGTVSLNVAIHYPNRVQKVVVIGSPIVGSSLAPALKLAGYRPIAFMLFNLMGLFRLAMRIASPTICRDPRFPTMMDRDLSSTTLESFLISIATLRKTDLRPNLHQVRVPVMGIYGLQDNIVNPKQYRILQKELPSSRIELFEKSAHFVMLDEHQRFLATLKDFLDTSN